MAAPAETLNINTSLMIEDVRPARLETFGRSLRTIYRLGAFMVDKAISEVINSPEASQAKAEFYTSVEEGFGTDLELGSGLEVRDFDSRRIIDGRVMAKDLKTAISDMTKSGLVCAEERAKTDQHFQPQRTRSVWDYLNALVVDEMASGQTDYNTRIVISPFPEEAAAQSGHDYWRGIGYVPHLRRGFVQMYHVSEEGLVSGSLSFDGSDKWLLREIFGRHGIDIPETEVTDNWLQYAITDTLSEDQAKALALDIAEQAGDPSYKKTINTVAVTHEHHSIMDKVFNESYIHACESHARGYQTAETTKLIFQLSDNAGKFNHRYTKALYKMRANQHEFTDDDMVVLHELLVYSTIEMMRALHLQKQEPAHSSHIAFNYQALDPEVFQRLLGGFGAVGAQSNRTYSACGLSISLGGESDAFSGKSDSSGKLPQTAFGGVDRDDNSQLEDCEFISKECPKCHKKNVKTVVKKGRYHGGCGCKS